MTDNTYIKLVTDITSQSYSNIVWEIQDQGDIDRLDILTITQQQKSILTQNLSKSQDEKRKNIFFYNFDKNQAVLTCIFLDKENLMDERCDYYRTLPTDSLIIPTWDIVGAYEALSLAPYRYQKYLSQKKKYEFWFFVEEKYISLLEKNIPLYEAITWSRDIINLPPHDSVPHMIVEEILSKSWKNFVVRIFDKKKLEELECNLLLAVWAGSIHEPYMIVLEPKNPPQTEKFGLIGKGVTFDAGWLQIKPDAAMLDMKLDISGAAGVIGVARYLDTLDILPVDVTIAIGLTENMTWDAAFKPLDIYKAYNGTTVEIHHTDAEWRLVLGDVMSYVEATYKVDHILTMAILTASFIHALGNDIAGIMGDDDFIISTLIDTTSPYEKMWRLPMTDKIKKSLKADIADIKNLTKTEKAWSSLGWAFLTYFQWDAKLTHIDIAWPAYRDAPYGYMPKGGTGWWVKVLSDFFVTYKSRTWKI